MSEVNKQIPLLSILIPTRNRMEYAIPTIRSILSIASSDFQLVVQDSSDSRFLEDFIKTNIVDVRLCYNYSRPPVHMVDNFNMAARLATGKYVCFIGDDDCVNPELMAAAQWAKDNRIDALMQHMVASYFWPDVKLHPSLRNPGGKLFVKSFSSKVVYPDVQAELKKLAHAGGQGYQALGLPKLYHGLVRRQCLEQVRELTGDYFKGLSPDIFGSVAVSHFVSRIASVDYPLTVGGTAGNSGAGASMAGKHKGRLEDAPHLRGREDYQWPDIIPRFYSVETIWAESAVVALRETNRVDLLREFNLPFLYALCLVTHPDFAGVIVRDMYRSFRIAHRNYAWNTLQFGRSLFARQSLQALATSQHVRVLLNSRGIHAIKERVRRHLVDGVVEYSGLCNTEEATHALSQHLRTSGHRFEDCV